MCHYSIGPLSNFFSKFLQGYFGLCHVSEIFYYLSTVHVSESKKSWAAFSETLILPNNSHFQIKNHKKLKKMMNIIWTPWTCKNPTTHKQHQIRTTTHKQHQIRTTTHPNTKSEPHTHPFSFGFTLKQHNHYEHSLSNTTSVIFEPKQGGRRSSLKFSGPFLFPLLQTEARGSFFFSLFFIFLFKNSV